MKKFRYSYCLKAVAFALTLMMMFAACQSHEMVQEQQDEERGFIVMSLNGVQTRGTRGEALFSEELDTKVTKVRVFVFVGSTLEVNKLFTADEPSFNNPFILDVVTGPKEVYVVANEIEDLSAIASKEALKGALAAQINKPIDVASTPLPMTGTATAVVEKTEDPEPHSNVKIMLTRTVAKISLQFKKSDIPDDIKITDISLLSNTGKTTLFPSTEAISGQRYWDFSHNLQNALTLNTTPQAIGEIGPIYLYENLDVNKATQLEVKALYNNIETAYRVYINEKVDAPGTGVPGDPNSSLITSSNGDRTIKRNHHYQLTGTISGLGEFNSLQLETEVLPWTLFSSEFNYEKVIAKFTVSPKPPMTGAVEVTDDNPQLDYKFNISEPVDATWTVALTNTEDFIIENDDKDFFTWGKVPSSTKIRIKAKATAPVNAKTEVIVSINGVEIDFNKNGFTGVGQRLVIVKK